jgi:hypothetical protein
MENKTNSTTEKRNRENFMGNWKFSGGFHFTDFWFQKRKRD